MDNFIYGIIDGSYLHGMQTNTSDVDIIEIYNYKICKPEQLSKIIKIPQVNPEEAKNRFNVLSWTPSRQIYDVRAFLFNLFYEKNYSYYRWFFPYKWLSDNELTYFAQRYGEDIVAENQTFLFQRLMAGSFNYFTLGMEDNSNKFFSKSFYQLCCLLEYAECGSYKESILFSNYRDLLLDIQANKFTQNELIQLRNKFLNNIDKVKNQFLDKPISSKYKDSFINIAYTTLPSKFYI